MKRLSRGLVVLLAVAALLVLKPIPAGVKLPPIVNSVFAGATKTETALPSAPPATPASLRAPQVMSFQDGVAPDSLYAGTQDTYVVQNSPDENYGTHPVARLAGSSPVETDGFVSALIRWDVSAIPADSQVLSATLTLHAVDTSSDVYTVYETSLAWDETTVTWATSQSALLDSGAFGWPKRGALTLAEYRPATPGPVVIDLSEALTVVQRWIDDPAQNHGLVIANSNAADAADFDTREALEPAHRPQLTIVYR